MAGEVGRLRTRAQRRRAAEHYRLAYWFARPWARLFPYYAEEINTGAVLGLIAAARAFDPSRPPEFGALLKTVVRRRCLMAVRGTTDADREAGRPRPTPGRLPADVAAPGPAETPPASGAGLAESMVSALPPSQSEAVRRVVIGGETLAAVAADRGCTEHAVYRAQRRGLDRLRVDPRVKSLA